MSIQFTASNKHIFEAPTASIFDDFITSVTNLVSFLCVIIKKSDIILKR